MYRNASAHGKRVQCNLGAKNHVVLMPDARRDEAVAAVISAAFGAGGGPTTASSKFK